MSATLAPVLERCAECSEPLTVAYDVASENDDVALCLPCAVGQGYPID